MFLTRRPAHDPFAAFDWLHRPRSASRGPALDAVETTDAYEIRLYAAGADPDKFEVAVEDGVLRLAGERPAHDDEAGRLLRREYSSGAFERRLRLPDDIDSAGTAARYEHGVLIVTLPKAAEKQPRRIDVHVA